MARIEKTVFISYRRSDVYTALAVYQNLKNQGYDVFFDYRSISSGDFEQIITSNIRARAHFLVILTPTALDRLNEPGDWLRREIETAIEEKRNIIPLFFKGFRFGPQSVSDTLTGKLNTLSRYNGLNVHEDYFEEAMHRLKTEFLSRPLDTVLHPVSHEVQKIVREEKNAADKALEQIEGVQELAKRADEKPVPEKELLRSPINQLAKNKGKIPTSANAKTWRFLGGISGGIIVFGLCMWGSATLLNNLGIFSPKPAETVQPTNPALPTETSTPPTSTLGIGSTMTGKDGMTLLYVPAGEFTAGSDSGDDDEKPVHTVTIDAFWIDQTEITNKMYSLCVEEGVCEGPTNTSSSTHSSYYGNPDFDNHPVIYVDWNMAKTYCEWADRRLPTEAEWEIAARGENANVYPWGNTFDGNLVNFCDTNCSLDWADKSSDDGFTDVAPVGSYPNSASVYGALDMAGNVWEWVNDWYSEPYSSSPLSNPEGPDSGQYRVLRGGSWVNDSFNVRSSDRNSVAPAYTLNSVGFRCALSADEQTETSVSQSSATEVVMPTPTLGIGSTITGEDSMTLLYVPAGEFTMGSDDGSSVEQPVHTVDLDAFWIDETEVTNAMYARCVADGVCEEPTDKKSWTRSSYYGNADFDNYPVIYVDWNMANTYCKWAGRRLPTEAEWEKAARGEKASVYPWGNDAPNNNVLNYNSAVGDTTEVGTYPDGASVYGAYDMAGNVWEWVNDWFSETYYASSLASNPLGPDLGQYRAMRGGSWIDNDYSVRSAYRYSSHPSKTQISTPYLIGFRCAMSATP